MITPTERARLREFWKTCPMIGIPALGMKLLDSLDELERERDLLRADWEAMRECLSIISKPYYLVSGTLKYYEDADRVASNCLDELKVKP